MSISSNQNAVSRIQIDLANLQKKIAEENKKEAQLHDKINQIQRSITKSTSPSSLSSKLSQISRHNDDIAKCNIRKADISTKIASKTSELHRYQNQLSKDEEYERKKLETAQKKREKEQLEFQRKLANSIESQNHSLRQQVSRRKVIISEEIATADNAPEHDVFISHASEDKESFVRPFAEHLKSLGVNVWYDEFSLSWGDSLRKSIDKGLSGSRFGIVVISKNFVKKPWTEYEFNGLVAAEIEGTKRVLPIWHEISKSEVMKFSPTLGDKLALNTSTYTIEEIAEQLIPLLR